MNLKFCLWPTTTQNQMQSKDVSLSRRALLLHITELHQKAPANRKTHAHALIQNFFSSFFTIKHVNKNFLVCQLLGTPDCIGLL